MNADQDLEGGSAQAFSAVVGAEAEDGIWFVSPLIDELSGEPAAEMKAIAADGIKPEEGNTVLCVTSLNDFEQKPQSRFDNPGAANPVIIAVFANEITRDVTLNILRNLNVKGKAALGAATKKMVLGENLGLWAAQVDASLTALYAYLAAVQSNPLGGPLIPPWPGVPLPPTWSPGNLSQNHKLD